MTLVSVIIPTYNRSQLAVEAIDSVLGQTCEDWKVIVVDDGSTDDTRDKVESIKDARVCSLYTHELMTKKFKNICMLKFMKNANNGLPTISQPSCRLQ